jgi:hypothetical protein
MAHFGQHFQQFRRYQRGNGFEHLRLLLIQVQFAAKNSGSGSDLRSGLFREENSPTPYQPNIAAPATGFGIIENFDRYSQPVGLDLIPQRVAAAADQQQLCALKGRCFPGFADAAPAGRLTPPARRGKNGRGWC